MDIIRKIAAILAGLGEGIVGGLFKAVFRLATGRDLDAEAAAQETAEDEALKAEARAAEVEARHEETLAAAARQAVELRELRKELAAYAERRARHAAYGRAHERAAEVRSSRWEPEPEPESGAPMAPSPA